MFDVAHEPDPQADVQGVEPGDIPERPHVQREAKHLVGEPVVVGISNVVDVLEPAVNVRQQAHRSDAQVLVWLGGGGGRRVVVSRRLGAGQRLAREFLRGKRPGHGYPCEG